MKEQGNNGLGQNEECEHWYSAECEKVKNIMDFNLKDEVDKIPNGNCDKLKLINLNMEEEEYYF